MTIIAAEEAPDKDPATRRKTASRRMFSHIGILICVLAVWEFVTWSGIADPLMFPRPSAIVRSLILIYFIQGNIWWHLWITMSLVLAGFFIGSLFGMGLAIAVGLSDTLRRYLKPYIIIMEATPRIAMGPLLIAWLGFGFESKLAIVVLVCFFAPFVNTLTGMLTTDQERMEMMRALRATKRQIFWKVMLPGMMPIVMAGLRLAMASALGGALVAEFISADQGMGVILTRYTSILNMPSAFASLLTLTAVGFLLYRMMEVIEARIVFWQNDHQMQRVSRRRAAKWRNA